MNFLSKKIQIPVIFISSLILFLYACEKDISTTPPKEEPPKGFIFVDSNPTNYKIYLDGRFTGRFTPDTLPYIEETEHLIELKRKYWLDSSSTIIAEPEVIKPVYIDFMKSAKVFGSLELKSVPENATIEIDDSLTTLHTPSTLTGLLPGVYNVTYHLDKHRSISAKTMVQSNKSTKVNMTLQDTSIWVDYTTRNSSLPNNNITTLAIDKDNKLWAGTINKGIVIIKGNKWEFLNTNNSLIPSDRIRVIEVDENNSIWIGTDDGLVEYKDGMIQQIYNQYNTEIVGNSQINAIDFYNDMVIAGSVDGILTIRDGESKLYQLTDGEGVSTITAIKADENRKIVWAGVKGNIVMYEVRDYGIYNPKGSANSRLFGNLFLTKMLIRPSDGKLWALFSSSGVRFTLPNGSSKLLNVPPYLVVWNGAEWYYEKLDNKEEILTDAIVSKDNYIWITTNMGLRKQSTIRIVDKVVRSFNSGIFSEDLTAIEETETGMLWIGSTEGLFKYKKNLLP